MTDARIPDHCGWAARGYWREAYDDAVAEIRKVTAERERQADRIMKLEADNTELASLIVPAIMKAQAADAEVARLTAQAREDAMQLLATSGQAQDAMAEVATLRAELDASRGRVKPGVAEREIWGAMAWAVRNSNRLPGTIVPEYTDTGNSDAEYEARRAAARILAAIAPDPAVVRMREALKAELADAVKQADADLAEQNAMEVAMDYPMQRKMTPAMRQADRIRAALKEE